MARNDWSRLSLSRHSAGGASPRITPGGYPRYSLDCIAGVQHVLPRRAHIDRTVLYRSCDNMSLFTTLMFAGNHVGRCRSIPAVGTGMEKQTRPATTQLWLPQTRHPSGLRKPSVYRSPFDLIQASRRDRTRDLRVETGGSSDSRLESSPSQSISSSGTSPQR